MSDQNIIAALTVRLQAFAQDNGLAIAYEGRPFTPDATKTHLAEYLLPASTINPSMGRQHIRYEGIYQVDVDAPTGSNVVALRNLANEIAAHFPRGLTLELFGQKVLITRTPSIGPLIPDGGRMKRPVSIRYQSDVIA